MSKRSHISPNPSVFAAGRGSCWGQSPSSPRAVLAPIPGHAALSPSGDIPSAHPWPGTAPASLASPARSCGLGHRFPSFPCALAGLCSLPALLRDGQEAQTGPGLGQLCIPSSPGTAKLHPKAAGALCTLPGQTKLPIPNLPGSPCILWDVTQPQGCPLLSPAHRASAQGCPIPSVPAPLTPAPHQAPSQAAPASAALRDFFFFFPPSNIEMIFIKFAL